MANKMKSIFSHDAIEKRQNIEWKNNEVYKCFSQAVQEAYKSGEWETVEGEVIGQIVAKIGNSFYPISEKKELTELKIRLTPQVVPIPLKAQNEEIYADFYYAKDKIIIESANKVIELKITLFQDDTVNVEYKCFFNKVKETNDIVKSFDSTIAILNYIFKEDDVSNVEKNDDLMKVKDLINQFQNSQVFWERMDELEKFLGQKFDLSQIEISDDTLNLVEQLYYLLVKKKIIRLAAKLSNGKLEGIKTKGTNDSFKEGDSFSMTFFNSSEYTLAGKKIKVYTVNYLSDAIIKEIHKDGEEIVEVIYGDLDVSPMYISFTGFLEDADAKKEYNRINGSDERRKEYQNALPLSEYMKMDFIS